RSTNRCGSSPGPAPRSPSPMTPPPWPGSTACSGWRTAASSRTAPPQSSPPTPTPATRADRRAAQRRGESLDAARHGTGAARRDVGAVRRPVGAVPTGGPAMTTTADRSPLELLRDHARLQGAEHLLDPARLSALLGRDVEL